MAMFQQKFILQKQAASLIRPVGQFAHPSSRDSINIHQIKLNLTVLETKTFSLPSNDSLILS